MKRLPMTLFGFLAGILGAGVCSGQVSSGSDGHDGVFSPTTNTVVDMADHPDGIYHYTSVNIPASVTVSFVPNANNTPVIWLVQSNVVIDGVVDISGQTPGAPPMNVVGAFGGPGGFRGGNGGDGGSGGVGPGSGVNQAAAFGTLPLMRTGNDYSFYTNGTLTYGNQYLVPLIGGSGGGGVGVGQNSSTYAGGGGGGGALLIASSRVVELNGRISSRGGFGGFYDCGIGCYGYGGGGSGGGVRIVAQKIQGGGSIDVSGGTGPGCCSITGGYGRVRVDALDDNYGGPVLGILSRGVQPIIIQTNGQGAKLTIMSIGGFPVSASPSGRLAIPDAVLSAQQNNPIAVTVRCLNIPLNTQITVSVKPANSAALSATGVNNNGTLASSTATVLLSMPRGGGIIYATAAGN